MSNSTNDFLTILIFAMVWCADDCTTVLTIVTHTHTHDLHTHTHIHLHAHLHAHTNGQAHYS